MKHRAMVGLACATAGASALGQLGGPPGGAPQPPSVWTSTWGPPSPPPPPPPPDQRPEFLAQLAEKSAAIDAELAALDRAKLPASDWAKEWAGVYAFGGGALLLKIAPKAGIAMVAAPSTSNPYPSWGWPNFGSIAAGSAEGLTLKMRLDESDRWLTSATPLVFVAWGERRFVIPENRLLNAVNSLNAGESIDGWLEGTAEQVWEARITDPSVVSGRSQLPSKFAALVSDTPVKCKITWIEPRAREAAEYEISLQRRVRVDLGRRGGAFVGMWIPRTSEFPDVDIRLDTVGEDSSEGWYTAVRFEHVDALEPTIGQEFTLPGAANPAPPRW